MADEVTVVDAPAESSPADSKPTDGVSEFRAELQKEERSARETAKVAPDSEPVKGAEGVKPTAKPKQEPLSPEEQSRIKRESDAARFLETRRENEALKARLAKFEAGTADKPAEPATAKPSSSVKSGDDDPEPQEADFIAKIGTDYATEDAAFKAYLRALGAHGYRTEQRESKAKAETERTQRERTERADTIEKRLTDYGKDHEGFDDRLIAVDEAIQHLPHVVGELGQHEQSAELIDFMGQHPEMLKRLGAAKTHAASLIEYGRIVSAFESEHSKEEPVSGDREPRKTLPKPPTNLAARGHVPNGDAAFDAAASGNSSKLPSGWRNAVPQ